MPAPPSARNVREEQSSEARESGLRPGVQEPCDPRARSSGRESGPQSCPLPAVGVTSALFAGRDGSSCHPPGPWAVLLPGLLRVPLHRQHTCPGAMAPKEPLTDSQVGGLSSFWRLQR